MESEKQEEKIYDSRKYEKNISDSLPLPETLGKFSFLLDPTLNDTWGLIN